MPHFAVIDTETTGLDVPIKACEVAWIMVDENMNILSEAVHRVNPFRPIHPGASNIHGIYDHDVALCPAVEEVLKDLPQPFCAIGHNVAFDLRVIGGHIEYNADLCTLALSRRWVKGTTNHKLPTLQKELGLSDQLSHSALGDCYTALELLRHISKLSGRNLVQMIELESVPKMLNVMPFGMHKGKPFSEVPRSYREWLASRDDLHKDLRYTLDKLRII